MVLGGCRYSPPSPPRYPHHPGYTLPPGTRRTVMVRSEVTNQRVVGLISVDQLSLSLQISGFQGITEVYNVVKAGNPNDHKFILGTK